MKKIMVGVDGGETSRVAAQRAATLARDLGAQLLIVVVVPKVSAKRYTMGSEDWVVTSIDQAENKALALAGEVAIDVDHEILVFDGSPPEVLVEQATERDVDLLVVGNVRMQGVGRLLGSVGSDVLHHAPCDVMVVKTA